jgi:hypothetical protein
MLSLKQEISAAAEDMLTTSVTQYAEKLLFVQLTIWNL